MGILSVTHENGNTAAPLEGSKMSTVVTVRTSKQRDGANDDRAYCMDLVIVVDTSDSMQDGGKLDKVKNTLEGIITGDWKTTEDGTIFRNGGDDDGWLRRDRDRLCIITFGGTSDVRFGLAPMTPRNRATALSQVRELQPGGNTNMKAGLQRAVDVIKGRRRRERQRRRQAAAGIILLSSGAQDIGDAREVDVTDVRVDTIGFGTKHDNMLLEEISEKSDGGTFSNSRDTKQLIQAISSLIDFSKYIVASDLVLTFKYPPTMSVYVHFGTYRQETPETGVTKCYVGSLRGDSTYRVALDFVLPPAQTGQGVETLMTYHWKCRSLIRGRGQEEASAPGGVPVKVLEVNDVVPKVVRTEQARLDHLAMLKEVRRYAAEGKFDEARHTLEAGIGKLDELQRRLTKSEVSLDAMDLLYAEAEEISYLLQSEDKYRSRGGQSYVAACISSHERQRCVTRGDDGGRVRLFATDDRMNRRLDDAIKLDDKMDDFWFGYVVP